MKKLAKILIPVLVLALVLGCFFVLASAEETTYGEAAIYDLNGNLVKGNKADDQLTFVQAMGWINDNYKQPVYDGETLVPDQNYEVRLVNDVASLGTDTNISMSALYVTVDLNGHSITHTPNKVYWSSALFRALPAEESGIENPVVDILIKGNGTINLNDAGLIIRDGRNSDSDDKNDVDFNNDGTKNGAGDASTFVFSMGARPTISGEPEEIDTRIVINHSGTTALASFADPFETVHLQNVDLFLNRTSDKYVASYFNLDSEGANVTLENSSVQVATGYQPDNTGSRFVTLKGGLSDGSLTVSNSYIQTPFKLIQMGSTVAYNEGNADAEFLNISNSTVIIEERSLVPNTAYNMSLIVDQGNGFLNGVANITDSNIRCYRVIEGNSPAVANAENSTFKFNFVKDSSHILRGGKFNATDCRFDFGNQTTPKHSAVANDAITFTNCFFNKELSYNGASTQYSSQYVEYPFVINPDEGVADSSLIFAWHGNEDHASNLNKVVSTGHKATVNADGTITWTKGTGASSATGSTKFSMSDSYRWGTTEFVLSGEQGYYLKYTVTDPLAGTSKASTNGKVNYASFNANTDGGNTNNSYLDIGPGFNQSYAFYDTTLTTESKWTGRSMVNGFDFAIPETGASSFRIDIQARNSHGGSLVCVEGFTFSDLVGGKVITLTPGKWYTVAVVFDFTSSNGAYTYTAKTYLNGELVSTKTMTNALTAIATGNMRDSKWWGVDGARIYTEDSKDLTIGTGFMLDNVYTRVYQSSDITKSAIAGRDISTLIRTSASGTRGEAVVGSASYSTLGEAINAAQPGQIVTIKDNVYSNLTPEHFTKGAALYNPERFAVVPTVSGFDPMLNEVTGEVFEAEWSTEESEYALRFLDGSALYYAYTDAPVAKYAYAIFSSNGVFMSGETNAANWVNTLTGLKNGNVLKIFTDIVYDKNTHTGLNNGSAFGLDLNGYTLRIYQKSGTTFTFNAGNSTMTIKSSRPGGNILAYNPESLHADGERYDHALGYAETRIFSLNGNNTTLNIQGENLTVSSISPFIFTTWKENCNTTVNIDGGTFIGLSKQLFEIDSGNTNNSTTFNVKNANLIGRGLNYGNIFYVAQTNRKANITIDNCTIIRDNQSTGNARILKAQSGATPGVKMTITNSQTNYGAPDKFTDGTLTRAAASFFTDDNNVANVTIGANVTSQYPFQSGLNFSAGQPVKLDLPVTNKLQGATQVDVNSVWSNQGPHSQSYVKVNYYMDKAAADGKIVLIFAGDSFEKGVIHYNPNNLTSTEGLVYGGRWDSTKSQIVDPYSWGWIFADATKTGYSEMVVSYANGDAYVGQAAYATTVQNVEYVQGATTLTKTTSPFATAEDVKAAGLPAGVQGGGVVGGLEGLYSISSELKITNVSLVDGKLVATISAEAGAVENQLEVFATLSLHDYFELRLLVKAEFLPYFTGVTVNGESAIGTYTVVKYGDTEYAMVTANIAPNAPAEEVTLVVTYAHEGNEGSVTKTTSILDYAEKALEQNKTAEAKDLILATLYYVREVSQSTGAAEAAEAAEAILAANTDAETSWNEAILDEKLHAAYWDSLMQETTIGRLSEVDPDYDGTMFHTDALMARLASVGLQIDETGIKFVIEVAEAGDLKVTINNKVVYNNANAEGTVVLDLNAFELYEEMTFEVGGETAVYVIDDYVFMGLANSESGDFSELLAAIYTYVKYANAYVNAQ